MANTLPNINDIKTVVRLTLAEDVGNGDRTAELIPDDTTATATVISRENAILCGTAWFDEVFKQLDQEVKVKWSAQDADVITPNQTLCQLNGSVRSLLTGERTALNFLQTLSGTATITHEYVDLLERLDTKILDTRKTLPGLRTAQKYAVVCGGGHNHRLGLFDAILIKENHILAAGGISNAITAAKQQGVPVETEVEDLEQLQEALAAGSDSVLLDNFTLEDLRTAVSLNQGRVKLEASGNINTKNLRSIAETGVDFISIGALTKNVRAIDFSMRFEQPTTSHQPPATNY